MSPGRVLGVALLCAPRGTAAAQEAPPPLTSRRYDEDYSYLEETPREQWWEHLKEVPLGRDTGLRLSTGAEVRARYERYENDAWGAGPEPDHDYVWIRALPYLELRSGEMFRVFGQLISAFELGDEAGSSPVDEDRVDLLQAFADIRIPVGEGALTLRGGREVLAYGSERLISARFGPNVLRSFDAAVLGVEAGAWMVDLLWGRPSAVELGAFDDRSDRSRSLWGAYGTCSVGEAKGVDFYYLGFENEDATFNQGSGREVRHTLGSRIFGREGSWDWNFELMGQLGRFDRGDLRAWSIASDTGYVLESLPLRPRIGLKADVISGDRDPADRELGTFNALFPKGKYFGEAGLIGPANLLDLHPTLDLALAEQWSLSLASVFYWRESKGDGLYDVAGQVLRPDGGSDARFIGSQFDVVLDYAPSRLLDLSLSWSLLLPGAFIEDTGPARTVHFFGAEVDFRF